MYSAVGAGEVCDTSGLHRYVCFKLKFDHFACYFYYWHFPLSLSVFQKHDFCWLHNIQSYGCTILLILVIGFDFDFTVSSYVSDIYIFNDLKSAFLFISMLFKC